MKMMAEWFQWNRNRKLRGAFQTFMEDFATVEKDLRENPKLRVKDIMALIEFGERQKRGADEWDGGLSETDIERSLKQRHQWTCNCGEVFEGDDFLSESNIHRNTCWVYNQLPQNPTFNHCESNCVCCIAPYHDNDRSGKRQRLKKWSRVLRDDFIERERKRRKLRDGK